MKRGPVGAKYDESEVEKFYYQKPDYQYGGPPVVAKSLEERISDGFTNNISSV